MRGDRQYRQRELGGIERFGIGLHVRRLHPFEAGVVHQREHAVRAQAGLDRIHQQQAAVGTGEFAGGVVELHRHRAARVAFAHHRLQEHRLDEPALGLGVGEGLAQRGHVVGCDGDDAVLAAVAGQVLVVGAAAGIGIQGRAVGAAVEAALDHQPLDAGAGMCGARIGLQLGVDVDDARGQADRLGAGVQAHEAFERAAAAGMANLLAQGAGETALGQSRGHDVGHDLRPGQGLEHRGRGMAEAEHAVAACVVQDRTLEGDHPGTARGQGHVGGDRIVGVEIDVTSLQRLDLRGLVQFQQVGGGLVNAGVLGGGRGHGRAQVRVMGGQALDARVIQAGGQALTGMGTQRGEGGEDGHADLPGVSGRPARPDRTIICNGSSIGSCYPCMIQS